MFEGDFIYVAATGVITVVFFVLEFWLGKTDKTKAGSTLELILQFLIEYVKPLLLELIERLKGQNKTKSKGDK